MKSIVDTSRVPPGGLFRATVPETGKTFSHPYFAQVKAQVHAHRVANNLPIPVNWEQWIEDQICAATPTCECIEAGTMPGMIPRAVSLARSIGRWVANGAKVVSEAVLNQRLDQCQGNTELGISRCPHWNGSRLFGTMQCGKCGCTKLKLYLPTERCPIGKW